MNPDRSTHPPHPSSKTAAAAQAQVLQPGQTQVVPMLEEQLDIRTERHDTGAVRVRKELDSRVETVQLPGWTQRAHIERIAIDQPAERVQPPRLESEGEGEVWVVPIYEERWVMVKQLYLREELRIAAVRESHERQESVTLLRERVVIERLDPTTGQWQPQPAQDAPPDIAPGPITGAAPPVGQAP